MLLGYGKQHPLLEWRSRLLKYAVSSGNCTIRRSQAMSASYRSLSEHALLISCWHDISFHLSVAVLAGQRLNCITVKIENGHTLEEFAKHHFSIKSTIKLLVIFLPPEKVGERLAFNIFRNLSSPIHWNCQRIWPVHLFIIVSHHSWGNGWLEG